MTESGARAVMAAFLCALAACATPPRPHPHPARHALTQNQQDLVDRDFYLAVDAYAKGDYLRADGFITAILRLDPRDHDALAMRRRVRAAERLTQ